MIEKATGFLTNSPRIAARVGERHSGDHRHIHMMGGRDAAAQVYLERLCRAICTGVKEQLRDDEKTRRTSSDHDKVRADVKRMTPQA
eukprot:6491785-Heterocapsa_arctica.AAC.1